MALNKWGEGRNKRQAANHVSDHSGGGDMFFPKQKGGQLPQVVLGNASAAAQEDKEQNQPIR